ncbi:MAG: hypothetical protein ACRDIC_11060 [bacterium]
MAPAALRSALIIVGNGPGEVAGWALPIAAEAYRWASEANRPIEVDLCLPPCQFASGREESAAASAGLFHHIVGPKATLRLGIGLPGWTPPAPAVVLHVGGDFWYSRRLARRWGARAFAFVERPHIARTHQSYERIFVPTRDVSDELVRRGVPQDKILVTGDPRHDALLEHLAKAERTNGIRASRNGDRSGPTVTFLAGSRDTVFSACFPFWVQTAAALRARVPDAHLSVAVSPYVSPGVRTAMIARHQSTLRAEQIDVEDGGISGILGSDLVLTIPGSNTLELALMRIPSIVVLPTNRTLPIPTEGVVEWITRAPVLGPALKRLYIREAIRRIPYVALPNMRARRRIMPELVGPVTPEQVATESAQLLNDREARRRLTEDLSTIPNDTGASRRIIAAMDAAWAGQ